MAVFRFFIFLIFIAYIEAVKPKSVNLALETVLEFNDKDTDVKFLDNVQQFLDKVNTVIRPNNTARRFASENKNLKFSDFIKTAIDILKTYDDDDLEDTFAVIDDEIRKYHYKGCKFHELVEDQSVRRFVAKKLDEIKDKPASKLRKSLDDALEAIDNYRFSGVQAKFFEYVNSLYGQDSNDKLKTVLNNLQTYKRKSKRANLNLIKMVRNGIKSIFFDHYSALNANARRDLKIKLESSWRSFKHPEKIVHKMWTIEYTDMDTKKIKTGKINSHTDDINQETTAPTFKQRKPNMERYNASSEPSKSKSKSSKLKAEVMYYPHDELKEKPKKHKSSDSKHKKFDHKSQVKKELSTSSELSDTEENIATTLHNIKHKPSHKKYRDIKETRENKRSKSIKQRKPNSKKLSSFLTLYPEEFTVETQKRFKVKSTTRKGKLYTLWEEKIKQKKRKSKKGSKRKSSKTKTNLRNNAEYRKVISESNTVINVEKAVVHSSSEDDASYKRNFKTNSQSKSTTKDHVWRITETTEYPEYVPTTYKKFRKHIISKETPPSEEGMSIESYEIRRRSLTEEPINTTSVSELKLNVLRRINNLERQMEEVKYKIDTKLPTADENTKETQLEPLQEGLTTNTAEKNTVKDSTNTNINTTLNMEALLNITQFETTKSYVESQNDSSYITLQNKNDSDNTGAKNIHQRMMPDDVDQHLNNTVPNELNGKANVPDDFNNEIGTDLNNVDNNMKNHNNSYYNNNLDASVKPFQFNEFYDDLTKLNNEEKAKEAKENDSKKILEETTKSNVNESNNPI